MPTLTQNILHKVTAAILHATGAPDDLAVQVADVLAENHLAGHDSHEILRIPEYVQSVRAGEIIPTARPRVLKKSATSRSGIFIFAVDAAVFRPLADYEKALAKTLGRIKGVRPAPGFDEVLVPGEPEARARVQRERDGISIPEDTWQAVCKVGNDLGVDVEAVAMRHEKTHAREP